MTDIGHNSRSNDVDGGHLRSFIERIEKMEAEKKAVATDISEIYKEAKGNGYNTKAIRKIIRMRAMDASKRAEEEAIIDIYMNALGEYADTPLGQAAIYRVGGGA